MSNASHNWCLLRQDVSFCECFKFPDNGERQCAGMENVNVLFMCPRLSVIMVVK